MKKMLRSVQRFETTSIETSYMVILPLFYLFTQVAPMKYWINTKIKII